MSGSCDAFFQQDGEFAMFDEDGDLSIGGSAAYITLSDDAVLLKFRDFIDREIQRRYKAIVLGGVKP